MLACLLACLLITFFRRCPANPTFFVFQWPFFTQMITTGSQTSQIRSNLNWKPLTRPRGLTKNVRLKLLFDVIFLSLPGQSNILCFIMAIYNLDDYHWQQTSQITSNSNQRTLTRSKGLSKNLSLKLLCDVIFPSLSGQSDIACYAISNFQSDEYSWKPNFSNHIKLKLKTSS